MKRKILIIFVIILASIILLVVLKHVNNKTKIASAEPDLEQDMEDQEIVQEEELEEQIQENVEQQETVEIKEEVASKQNTTSNATNNKTNASNTKAESNQSTTKETESNTTSTKQETVEESKSTQESNNQEVGEKFVYNSSVESTLIDVINDTPSKSMTDYGYSIKRNSSGIVSTGGFFTVNVNVDNVRNVIKNRVANMLTYSSGEIKVYCRDYYKNGSYVWTECFVL